MTCPKVSIIMPVYKAETTIRKSIDSILAQTLKDWELVVVDDGTPDESGDICDDYARNDARIIVIHKSNGGVSAARQTGLNVVSGEYVIHVDPDDWVEPLMLEELYKKAIESDADMTICDFIVDTERRTFYTSQCPSTLDASTILDEMFKGLHGSCWNKLVKKTCIDRCGAKFPVGINYCEDVCFNIQLLKHNIKVSYLNKAFYHYVQNQGSITNAYTIETLKTHQKYVQFLTEQLPEDSLPVVTSKEFVKKLAYRSAVLSNSDFKKLYPEITCSHGDSFLVGLMYNLAFRRHYQLAGLLRIIYRKLH